MNILNKSVIILSIIVFLCVGCGSSCPPEDVYKEILLQLVGKDNVESITVTNKFNNNIGKENMCVIEFTLISKLISGNWNSGNWRHKTKMVQVAYIHQGDKWYGKLINQGIIERIN